MERDEAKEKKKKEEEEDEDGVDEEKDEVTGSEKSCFLYTFVGAANEVVAVTFHHMHLPSPSHQPSVLATRNIPLTSLYFFH